MGKHLLEPPQKRYAHGMPIRWGLVAVLLLMGFNVLSAVNGWTFPH